MDNIKTLSESINGSKKFDELKLKLEFLKAQYDKRLEITRSCINKDSVHPIDIYNKGMAYALDMMASDLDALLK